MRHSVLWCIKQQTNTPSTLLSDLCVGTFPVHINLTRNPPGVYSLEITATDVFNLTDKNIISYTSGYLKTTKSKGYYIALQGWVTYEVQIVDYKVMLISFNFTPLHNATVQLTYQQLIVDQVLSLYSRALPADTVYKQQSKGEWE